MLSLEIDFDFFNFDFFFNRIENLPPLEFVVWFLRNLEYCIHILHPPTERMYLKMKIFQARFTKKIEKIFMILGVGVHLFFMNVSRRPKDLKRLNRVCC